MIIFGVCSDDDNKFETIARRGISKTMSSDDLLLLERGSDGICAAYNRILDRACSIEGVEAVVLLHDDLEIVDRNFRPKVLKALERPNLGVVGVVGAIALPGLAWWEGNTAGFVYESRGPMSFGRRDAYVDAVDGLLLVLSRAAFRESRFDGTLFPRFHGYDVDYCLQQRAAGRAVRVEPLDVLHRSKTGFGSDSDWTSASQALVAKWPGYIVPLRAQSGVERLAHRTRQRVSRGVRTAIRGVRRARLVGVSPSPHGGVASAVPEALRGIDAEVLCPVCDNPIRGQVIDEPMIQICGACEIGATLPPPTRDVTSDELFTLMYQNARLERRDTWRSEARLRADWVKIFVPDGILLEIGCATGEFLDVMATEGFDSYGVEASQWAATVAQADGANVTNGFLPDWINDHPGLTADAIAMWHVLEHVPDPVGLLGEIRGVLAPTGMLLLEVPNLGSDSFRRLGMAWEGAQPADHCFHYTAAGLARLLESSGFVVITMVEMSARPYLTNGEWTNRRNDVLLAQGQWPPAEYLRCVARLS